MGMNLQLKGVQVSLAIHAAAFALFFFLGGTTIKENKTIVIDLSVQSQQAGQVAGKKPESKRKAHLKQRNTTLPEAQRVAVPEKKEIDLPPREEEPIAPSLAENQAPVDALPAPSYGIADRDFTQGETALRGSKHTSALSAGATGKGAGHAKADYLKKNFSYIKDIIQRNMSYPVIARRRGWEGRVTVSFVVCIDGHVKNIMLEKASGIGLLDKNAVETVKKAAPFPRPPLEAEVIVPITYKLH